MTDAKYHTPEQLPLKGRVFRPTTPAELAEAVEQAFDYRGDVRLTLASGKAVEGYLFNRLATAAKPFVQVYPQDMSTAAEIPYEEIVAIAFTGEDTASGKSWEAWVTKKESQRQNEAQQEEAAARARGHL
ncbi:MAG: hypothetical protein E8D45_13485 [Nitrospira sp.]|nr:MAG: hypothetical protein E8D45_13485 [Nitrospira sp.]